MLTFVYKNKYGTWRQSSMQHESISRGTLKKVNHSLRRIEIKIIGC